MADSTKTTIRFWLMNHLQRAMKGGMTMASRTFLMTRTVRGGLYQVRRCEAGSCIVLKRKRLVDLEYLRDC